MGGRSSGREFSADHAIRGRAEDLLARAPFAKNVANALRGWTGKESLVLGLFGAWGSGKSSVKNMILEDLRRSPKTCPTIVEFNPWQWAGQEQLTTAFFREIRIALKIADEGKTGKARADKWANYGNLLSMGSQALKPLGEVATEWGVPGGGAIKFAAKGLEKLGDVAKKGANALKAQAKSDEKSLESWKNELSESLRELSRPVLVVMDDVDRLSASQIYLLFQLAKCNADFPNLIFMILCQRSIVEAALEEQARMPGREFLEKIVQVSFDLPLLDRPRLETALSEGLDRIISQSPAKKEFNEHRFANIYFSGLSEFFDTLRDVNRFLSSYAFHMEVFRRGKTFEVNPVDLIAIEAIRLFEPDVYAAMGKEQAALTGRGARTLKFDDDKEVKLIVEELLKKAQPNNKENVQGLLRKLFPKIAHHLGAMGRTTQEDPEWFLERRICHSDIFQKYFVLGTPTADITREEIDKCLAATHSSIELLKQLQILAGRGRLGVFVLRLTAFIEKLDLKDALPFTTGLMDAGDLLPPEANDSSRMLSASSTAKRVIHHFLKREADAEKRGNILKQAVEASKGLYLPCEIANSEQGLNEKKSRVEPIASKEIAATLVECCKKRLAEYAANGKLIANPFVRDLLGQWSAWSPAEAKAWITATTKTPDGALGMLSALSGGSTVSNMEDQVGLRRWSVNLASLERYMDLSILEDSLTALDESKLKEHQLKPLQAFRHALVAKSKGGLAKNAWVYEDGEIDHLPGVAEED